MAPFKTLMSLVCNQFVLFRKTFFNFLNYVNIVIGQFKSHGTCKL